MLSMDLRAINLLVAAMIRFKINFLKQILVPTHHHHVLANNWWSYLDLQGKFPACYLGVKELPHGRRSGVPWPATAAGAGCTRETLKLALLTPTQGFS